MMDRTFEVKLIECLSALEHNEPLEDILARYPEDAAALRSILRTAIAVNRTRPEPNPAAQARSRAAFLAQADELRATAVIAPQRRRLFHFPVLEAFTLVVILAGFVGSLYAAAGAALPGTPMYGAKLTIESLRLDLAPGASAYDALLTQFADTRIEEVEALLRNESEADVTFRGTIESIDTMQWQVAGIPVALQDATRITGVPAVGLVANVAGYTQNGMLTATEILIEGSIKPSPTPTISSGQSEFNPGEPSATPTTTEEPIVQPTQEPAIVFPTATPVPPTATMTPTLEPPPSGGGGGDDGGGGSGGNTNRNENSNDNEDDHGGNSGPGGGGGEDD